MGVDVSVTGSAAAAAAAAAGATADSECVCLHPSAKRWWSAEVRGAERTLVLFVSSTSRC